jgi:hypothetical protein
MAPHRIRPIAPFFIMALLFDACFQAPMTPPPKSDATATRLAVPYDLAWDAVNEVIRRNSYKVRAQDPNQGIIEAQATSFTRADADCGDIKGLGGTLAVDPTSSSSAEYNFRLKPDGPEASTVSIDATYIAPLRVPFHPPRDTECVSRGINEARLLKEVEALASVEHRPTYRGLSQESPHGLSLPAMPRLEDLGRPKGESSP